MKARAMMMKKAETDSGYDARSSKLSKQRCSAGAVMVYAHQAHLPNRSSFWMHPNYRLHYLHVSGR
eukprot:SAG25_NODE_14032_length_260_cov_0.596273_1_plen_65_part_10